MTPSASSLPTPVSLRPRALLLEREPVLDAVSKWVSAAAARSGSMVFVRGEAGVGKTTLLRHAAATHASESRWIWGGCDPLATPRALGPLHDVARVVGGTLAHRMFTGAPREAVFAAALDVLDDDAAGTTIIVLEDIHWADQATLDLLVFLGRRIASRRAAVFVTYREGEGAAAKIDLDAVIGALPAASVHHLALEPLSREAVGAMAREAGRDAGALFEISGGNPFFVTELLAAPDVELPQTIRAAVLTRTRALSAGARAALELLAMLPRMSDLSMVQTGLGVDTEPLRELVAAGLLVTDASTVSFRHELARRAVESGVDALTQRQLHGRIVRALADRHETIGDVPLAHIVHHARAAGDVGAIRRFAPPAAREAAGASAHREALSLYSLALTHADSMLDEERADLLERWSVEAYLEGDVTGAIDARTRVLDVWRRTGRLERAGAALRWLSRLHWWAAEPALAVSCGEESVRVLEQLSPSPAHELAMAFSNLSQLHMLSFRTDEAIAWGERALAVARPARDVEAMAHALTNVGSARLLRGDAGAPALLEEAFVTASAAHLDDHAQRALVNLAVLRLEARHYMEAERDFDRAIRYADAHDLDAYRQYLEGQRARLHLERGAWTLAEKEARSALALGHRPGVTTIPAVVVLGTIQARRGDDAAVEILARARALAYATGEAQRVGPTAAALAELAWLRGDAEAVRREAEHGLDVVRAAGQSWILGELLYRLRSVGVVHPTEGTAVPWLLLLRGDWRGSADAWLELGCPYERAESLAAGDEQAMKEALAVFDSLEARARAARLRRDMRARGLRVPAGPRRATRANRAGLTRRQLDVLQRVADGDTNQEIADALNLAPKTVDHHVSAILRKLGVDTRRNAARAARQQGLLHD